MATLTINGTDVEGYRVSTFNHNRLRDVANACKESGLGCFILRRDNVDFVAYRRNATICSVPLDADASANVCTDAGNQFAGGPVIDWDGKRTYMDRAVMPGPPPSTADTLRHVGVLAAATAGFLGVACLASKYIPASSLSHSATLLERIPGFAAKTVATLAVAAGGVAGLTTLTNMVGLASPSHSNQPDPQMIERAIAH